MESIKEIIKKKQNPIGNVNNNKYILNNDINDNNDIKNKNGKYALDRTKFVPHTPEAMLADRIATELDDAKSFACFLKVVNTIGTMNAERLLKSTLSDIKEKAETKYFIRKKGAYFMDKYKHNRY